MALIEGAGLTWGGSNRLLITAKCLFTHACGKRLINAELYPAPWAEMDLDGEHWARSGHGRGGRRPMWWSNLQRTGPSRSGSSSTPSVCSPRAGARLASMRGASTGRRRVRPRRAPHLPRGIAACRGTERAVRERRPVKLPFEAVLSVPGFEPWLLLHVEDVFAPPHPDEAMDRLRGDLAGYAQGPGSHGAVTRERVDVATARANALLAAGHAAEDGTQPCTGMHELVHRLLHPKDQAA